MVRVLRGLLGFAYGVLLAWVWLVPDALAEAIPATPSTGAVAPTTEKFRGNYNNATDQTSLSAAVAQCTARHGASWCTVCNSSNMGWGYRHNLSSGSGCGGTYYGIDQTLTCPAGSTLTAPGGAGQAATCVGSTGGYTCPANQNWTLQGNQCVRADCPMGYRKPDGTCDPCPAGKYAVRELAGHLGADDSAPRWGSPFELSLSGSGASVPDSVCHQGCTLDLAGGDLNFAGSGGPSGQWSWLGAPKFSGATCSASSADPVAVQPNSPEAACVAAGQGYGTVNGTVVCVPQVDTKRREVKEVTGPAGGKTVTIENQVCTGGSCTSTTTVTHSGGGAAGGQADGSSTSSSVGGSSTKGDGSSACEENPFSAACLGNGATQEGLGQGDGGGGITSISPVSLPGAAVCPADLQLPHGVTLPFRHACEFAVLVRPFVLILGWLSAGFFVVGGLRSG